MPKTDRELAENHRYKWLDGTPLVNVTAIAECLDPGDKAGRMAGAAAKIAAAGGNYRAEWNAKRDIGTRVHGYAEAFLAGQSAEVTAGDEGYADALEKFLTAEAIEPLEVEAILLSRHGYGGRCDLFATMNGTPSLLDFKTGGCYPTALTLQLAAYRYADGIAVYHPSGTLDTLRERPKVDLTAGVYLHADGTYTIREVAADEVAFAHFVNLLAAHRWAKAIEKEKP